MFLTTTRGLTTISIPHSRPESNERTPALKPPHALPMQCAFKTPSLASRSLKPAFPLQQPESFFKLLSTYQHHVIMGAGHMNVAGTNGMVEHRKLYNALP